MRFLCFILGFLLLTAGSAFSQQNRYDEFRFNTGEFQLPYRMLLPENFDSTKQYPVVLFLHGAGERGIDNVRQLQHGSKLFSDYNLNAEQPFVVIFPQCPEDSYWASVQFEFDENGKRTFNFTPHSAPTLPLNAVMSLMDSIIQLNWSDNQRIYLGGLSMGGMGTFELLYRMPETFAASFAICGGGNVEILAPVIAKTPIWIFHGQADQVVPVKYSISMAEALKKLKADIRISIYPGVDHNAWDPAFSEPDLIPWLLSKKLM